MSRLYRVFLIAFFNFAIAVSPGSMPAKNKLPENDQAVKSAIGLLESWIEARMEYDKIPGLSMVIVYDKSIIWQRGFGMADVEQKIPATPKTLYRAASITKLFTATALMQLRDAGRLRLDDPVEKHLPWFKPQNPFIGAKPITIWHLLTHTSGLPREAAFPYWTDHNFPTLEEMIKALPAQKLIYPPETRYKYSNLGLAIAGQLVAAVAGETYETYVEKNILQPLKMMDTAISLPQERIKKLARAYSRLLADGTRTTLPVTDFKGIAPSASLTTTVEDLAKFIMLQFDAENSSSSFVLSGNTLREMQRLHWIFPGWKGGRGLGFIIRRVEEKNIVGHGGWVGGFRSQLGFIPEDKIGVAVMINADDGTPGLFLERAISLVGKAMISAARPIPTAPKPDPLWNVYLGKYIDSTFWESEVIILDGKLKLYSHSYPPEDDPAETLIDLEPVAKHIFRSAGPNGDGEFIVFEMSRDGKVVRLKVGENYLVPKK